MTITIKVNFLKIIKIPILPSEHMTNPDIKTSPLSLKSIVLSKDKCKWTRNLNNQNFKLILINMKIKYNYPKTQRAIEILLVVLNLLWRATKEVRERSNRISSLYLKSKKYLTNNQKRRLRDSLGLMKTNICKFLLTLKIWREGRITLKQWDNQILVKINIWLTILNLLKDL